MNIKVFVLALTIALSIGLVLVITNVGFTQDNDPQDHDHKAGEPQHEHVVKMQFNEDDGTVYFEPARLEINSGDTVTWVQDDEFNPHNVASYPDGIPESAQLFESPLFDKVGQSYSMTFTLSGTYRYHCHPHEEVGMKGVIIVDRESRPDEFRKVMSPEIHQHGAGSDDDHADDDSNARQ